MRRSILIACVRTASLTILALLSGAPWAPSGTERSASAEERKGLSWNIADFPASIRDKVYLTADKVPAYPMDDRRLKKPKNWPETMTIGGVLCARRIHAWGDDDAFPLESLEHVEPLVRLTLFYDHHSSKWMSANAGWGPLYSWNEKKKLTQRIWYEPDSTRMARQEYTYYKNGHLLGYSWRNEPRRPSGRSLEYLSQFYDKEGRLIAVCYERIRPDEREEMYVWMGTEVPYDNFRMKTHAFYSRAHPGGR